VKRLFLENFWERLKSVRELTLSAHSYSENETGWKGRGRGKVLVASKATFLTFQEKGIWEEPNRVFSNTFRWTLDLPAERISLEHLRLGPHQPVFLFHLAPTTSHLLASVDAHVCGRDAYSAQIAWDQESIRLSWRVQGPKKNEEVNCHYK
jgi:hypothetical protein